MCIALDVSYSFPILFVCLRAPTSNHNGTAPLPLPAPVVAAVAQEATNHDGATAPLLIAFPSSRPWTASRGPSFLAAG